MVCVHDSSVGSFYSDIGVVRWCVYMAAQWGLFTVI